MSRIESRCGLLCSECDFREKFNCGSCVETNGHPFHGDDPPGAAKSLFFTTPMGIL
ncbi:MAG: hypothetical protein GX851_06035 [Clostridiales bacterium]|nr:hypothetical protein [Clostridiales bacterium]